MESERHRLHRCGSSNVLSQIEQRSPFHHARKVLELPTPTRRRQGVGTVDFGKGIGIHRGRRGPRAIGKVFLEVQRAERHSGAEEICQLNLAVPLERIQFSPQRRGIPLHHQAGVIRGQRPQLADLRLATDLVQIVVIRVRGRSSRSGQNPFIQRAARWQLGGTDHPWARWRGRDAHLISQ